MARDARFVTAIAFIVRLAVAMWGAAAIPPTADGTY